MRYIIKTFTFSSRSSQPPVIALISIIIIIIVDVQTISGRVRTVHRGWAITVTPTSEIVITEVMNAVVCTGDKTTIRTARLE